MPPFAIQSIQSLLIQIQFNDQKIATGTGFVVLSQEGEPYLITNRHNFTGRNQLTNELLDQINASTPNKITIFHNEKGSPGTHVKKEELLFQQPDDQPRWIEHPTLGPIADFVALKLTELEGVEFYPYNPGMPCKPREEFLVGPAEPVSVIGFPFGITVGSSFAIWATGFIASELDVDYDEKPMFLIDCRARQGQSGSPVIAYRPGGTAVPTAPNTATIFENPVDQFLGIYSGRVNKESDLGMVWKASAIDELVKIL